MKVVDLSRTGKNEVEATFSGEKRLPGMAKKVPGEVVPDMLKVRYTFDEHGGAVSPSKASCRSTLPCGRERMPKLSQNLDNGREAILPMHPPNHFNDADLYFGPVHLSQRRGIGVSL